MHTLSSGQGSRQSAASIETVARREQPDRAVSVRGLSSTSAPLTSATSGSYGITPPTKGSRLSKKQTAESRQLRSGKQISIATTAQEREQHGSRRSTGLTNSLQNIGTLDEERPLMATSSFKHAFRRAQVKTLSNVPFSGLPSSNKTHEILSENQTKAPRSSVTEQHSTNLQDATSQLETIHKRPIRQAGQKTVSASTPILQTVVEDKTVDTQANCSNQPSLTHEDAAMQGATSLQLQPPSCPDSVDALAIHDTVPLATAISTPAPFDLIYGEAERQLRHFSTSSHESPAPNLRTYYRNLFINATTELDSQTRLNLLI
ncbi:hypothetical protein AOQ84DRAFT_376713, partial [Glonium stellatum]